MTWLEIFLLHKYIYNEFCRNQYSSFVILKIVSHLSLSVLLWNWKIILPVICGMMTVTHESLPSENWVWSRVIFKDYSFFPIILHSLHAPIFHLWSCIFWYTLKVVMWIQVWFILVQYNSYFIWISNQV